MKSILIIGAGFLQTFVIKKAKELGYYVIAIDKNPKSVGFIYADEWHIVDIIDQDACLKFAMGKSIDGVITVATDYGVLSASLIAETLGIPGLNYESAKIIKNKYLVRQKLFESSVDDISQYYTVSNIDDIYKIKNDIHYPVMVKPADGSGSKGINRVDCFSDLINACNFALDFSISKKILIEDFVVGQEYGVESVVYNGKVHVLGVMKKEMTSPPAYAELGHSLPNDLKDESKIKSIAHKAIDVLGINFGAVNMDVLVTKDNKVYIIDVGARMGGNLIGSHIISIGTGIDYLEGLLKISVGENANFIATREKKCVSTRLLALSPGKIKELPNLELLEKLYDVNIYHYLKRDAIINKYENNLDSWGYVVSVGKNAGDVFSKAEITRDAIDKSIQRF